MPDAHTLLQQRLGISFTNDDLLRMAMTHSSMTALSVSEKNYERLEFLGDRVLGFVMADLLYARYPYEKEGDLAKRHAALVQGKTLAAIARKIDLGTAMILSEAERAASGADNDNMLADGLEALLGALYLDAGILECKNLINRLWDELLDVMLQPPQDPKTALQEWAQGKGLPLPAYQIIEREGPDHAPVFTIRVNVTGHKPVEATGASRRMAEKNAAEKLLSILQER
jgi:ribonuclease-3